MSDACQKIEGAQWCLRHDRVIHDGGPMCAISYGNQLMGDPPDTCVRVPMYYIEARTDDPTGLVAAFKAIAYYNAEDMPDRVTAEQRAALEQILAEVKEWI